MNGAAAKRDELRRVFLMEAGSGALINFRSFFYFQQISSLVSMTN